MVSTLIPPRNLLIIAYNTLSASSSGAHHGSYIVAGNVGALIVEACLISTIVFMRMIEKKRQLTAWRFSRPVGILGVTIAVARRGRMRRLRME
ncbi:hypothetical protein BDV18DRAFT_142723 [Aspergillus unguis]